MYRVRLRDGVLRVHNGKIQQIMERVREPVKTAVDECLIA